MQTATQESIRPTDKREQIIDGYVLWLSNNLIVQGVLSGDIKREEKLVEYAPFTTTQDHQGVLLDHIMYEEAATRYAEQHGFLPFGTDESSSWTTNNRKPFKIVEQTAQSPRFPHVTLVKQRWIVDEDIVQISRLNTIATKAVVAAQGDVWKTRYLLRPADVEFYRPASPPR